MNKMLALLLVLIPCAMAGKKIQKGGKGLKGKGNGNGKYYAPKKWPTDKPTEEPTSDPTMNPTIEVCPSKFMDPSTDPIEFVFVVDNSCGLSDDECSVQMQEIADTLMQIKIDDHPYYTKVAYVEFCESGAETKIGFKDSKYQRDVEKYYDFILNEAGCGKGGNGETDTVSGLQEAVDEYLANGDDDKDVNRKIIMFNNCENSGYDYDEDDIEDFEDVINQLKNTEYFTNSPDLMVINVPAQFKPARNAISEPYDYLSFLIPDKSSKKPSPAQLYVAPARYLNDDEMTSEDYTEAAVVDDGRIPDRDDLYRNADRICKVVGKPNTEVPTEEPTANPTEYPTEIPTTNPTDYPTEDPSAYPTENPTSYPTQDPTEPKKVCFKVDYKMPKMPKMGKAMNGKQVKAMTGKQGNNAKCMATWELYKEGMKRPVQSGNFNGYGNGNGNYNGNGYGKKCVYIQYPHYDYSLSIKKGCGKVTWSVDGQQCGYHDFGAYDQGKNSHGKKQSMMKQAKYVSKDFPLRCPVPNKKYSNWAK